MPTDVAILLAPSPWTGRLIPCTVEAGWVMSQCGPVSRAVPLVVRSEAMRQWLRELGYVNVTVEER